MRIQYFSPDGFPLATLYGGISLSPMGMNIMPLWTDIMHVYGHVSGMVFDHSLPFEGFHLVFIHLQCFFSQVLPNRRKAVSVQ